MNMAVIFFASTKYSDIDNIPVRNIRKEYALDFSNRLNNGAQTTAPPIANTNVVTINAVAKSGRLKTLFT